MIPTDQQLSVIGLIETDSGPQRVRLYRLKGILGPMLYDDFTRLIAVRHNDGSQLKGDDLPTWFSMDQLHCLDRFCDGTIETIQASPAAYDDPDGYIDTLLDIQHCINQIIKHAPS